MATTLIFASLILLCVEFPNLMLVFLTLAFCAIGLVWLAAGLGIALPWARQQPRKFLMILLVGAAYAVPLALVLLNIDHVQMK